MLSITRPLFNPPTSILGRDDEWRSLLNGVAQKSSCVTYVWGAPGVGKTYLIQHYAQWLKEHTEIPLVWSPGRDLALPMTAWLQRLYHDLNFSSEELFAGDNVRENLLSRCRIRPFHWIVDDIDALAISPSDIADIAQSLLACGGRLTLTGRLSPFQLWPKQDYFRMHLNEVPLNDWNSPIAEQYLTARGVKSPDVVTHIMGATHGRPQLLSAAADGLTHLAAAQIPESHTAFMANAVDLNSFLIEQLCHPGSMRLSWRAGQPSDPLDTLIAAAALAPMMNREWMTRVVGRSIVNQAWDKFIALPILESYRGGYYGLFPVLREQVAHVVQDTRPWMWERSVQRTTAYYLSLLTSQRIAPDQAWDLLSWFIRPRLGEHPFRCDSVTLTTPYIPPLPTTPATELTLIGDLGPIIGAHTLLEEDTLEIHPQVLSKDPLKWVRLVSFLGRHFHRYRIIRWTGVDAHPDLVSLLQLLHFIPENDNTWQLSFDHQSYRQWLEAIVAPPVPVRPNDPVGTTQAILQNISAGKVELHPDAEAYWTSVGSYSTFHTWFVDALNSAPLGERVDGKTPLILYYLDHRGTHEELAELLHVSRATYFRNHRQALERLADAVFR